MSRKMKDSGVEWIGEIPENWNCYKMKFKGILASNGVDKKTEEGQEICKAIHYMDVYRNSLSTIENNTNCLTVSANHKQFIDCQLEKGDLLFTNSSETPEDIGHSTLIETTMPKTLFGYHLMRFRPNKDELFSKFLLYFCGSNAFRGFLSFRAVGVTRYSSLGKDFANAILALPSIYTQQQIAAYIDSKCSLIDKTIKQQKQVIEKLKEYRQSVITGTVTKGLDPNVPMKNSGVEWIGEIPEDWETCKFKFRCNNSSSKMTYVGNLYIGLESIEPNTGKLITGIINENKTIEGICNIFRKGDLLYGKLRPYLNKCIIAPADGQCSTELLVLDTIKNDSQFIQYWVLSSRFSSMINAHTFGAKMPRTDWNSIGSSIIVNIPTKIQRLISAYLDSKCSSIDNAIATKEQVITKLEEYKKSLIYEYVTGKKEVYEQEVING